MAESWLLIHTAIAILGTVVMIAWARVPPLLALFIGTAYLGLATGMGMEGTMTAVTDGFGSLMAEIGLLITFGVMMGSMLTSTHALQRLIEALFKVAKPGQIPYVFAVSLTTLFTSIYSDVLLVLTAPLAKRIGPRIGPKGLAIMGGALTAGIEVGLVFVVPGVGALAVAGLLGVPLGQMLIFGLLIGLPTSILTVAIFNLMARRMLRWNPATDELGEEVPEAVETENDGGTQPGAGGRASSGSGSQHGSTATEPGHGGVATATK
ncbi:GntP family permease, partial [Arthrobacter sp. H14]|uniref:GntP family permease n=1 Tax=Arthrobacter sp. H14 TaxID=1312959 RepID=UPI001C1E0B1C